MKIAIGSGGTGGHISPAIAFAQALKDAGDEFMFFGAFPETYRSVFESEEIPYRTFTLKRGTYRIASISTLAYAARTAALSVSLIPYMMRKKTRPDAVVCFGAYATLPLIIAAFFARVPIVLHEQNVIPGRINRICSRIAARVALSHVESQAYFKKANVSVTGNPVRKGLFGYTKSRSLEALGLADQQEKTVVLVLGGSQGASSINRAVTEALPMLSDLSPAPVFLHVTGSSDYEQVKQAYEGSKTKALCWPFQEDMGLLYTSADLVVCRAGASTIAELTCFALPAVLVPYPYAARNHQYYNAKKMKDAGAALILEEKDMNAQTVARDIKGLLNNEQMMKQMSAASGSLSNKRAAEWLRKAVQSCAE